LELHSALPLANASNMALAGIDFSLNSPAICIQTSTHLKWISLYHLDRDPALPTLKAFKLHEELADSGAITSTRYAREVSSKLFLERERQKMTDAERLAQLIIGTLLSHDVTRVAIEGFSYGSKGNSFIDMVVYNTFLRQKLIQQFGVESFHVFQPTTVKKLAGKGNGNKLYMFEAFKRDHLLDPMLRDSTLWQWSQSKEFSKEIPKPLDDLIDSYFILRALNPIPSP